MNTLINLQNWTVNLFTINKLLFLPLIKGLILMLNIHVKHNVDFIYHKKDK